MKKGDLVKFSVADASAYPEVRHARMLLLEDSDGGLVRVRHLVTLVHDHVVFVPVINLEQFAVRVLSHGDKIFNPAWGRFYYATVGTVQGMHAKDKAEAEKWGREMYETIETALARCADLGHAIAFATRSGTCLSADLGHYERRRKLEEEAAPIEAGEFVRIEGVLYRVRMMGKDYSDPIHFVKVEVA